MNKHFINPENIHKPRGYSHAIKVGNTVYISGQVALSPDGRLVGAGDPVAQAKQVCDNLNAILEAAGASFSDVVCARAYVTSSEHWGKMLRVIAGFFGTHYPVYTTVLVQQLFDPGYLLELEAIAVVEN